MWFFRVYSLETSVQTCFNTVCSCCYGRTSLMTSQSQACVFIQTVNNLTLLDRWRKASGGRGRRGGWEWGRGWQGEEKCIVAWPNSGCWKEAYKNSECMGSFQGCKVRFAECFRPWINWPPYFPLKNCTCPKGSLIALTTAPCQGQMVTQLDTLHQPKAKSTSDFNTDTFVTLSIRLLLQVIQ